MLAGMAKTAHSTPPSAALASDGQALSVHALRNVLQNLSCFA
jgi:hypothetical protein